MKKHLASGCNGKYTLELMVTHKKIENSINKYMEKTI